MLKALTMGRRHAMAGLASLCATPARSAPTAFPEGATLLVAGPAGGRADRWADLLAPALERTLLPGAGALGRVNIGGPDGVTGANQFEARASPDGATALLVPGLAALSWLSGESRVHFDAARWVPVWAGNTSAALASRVRLAPGRPVRVAASSVAGPDMAALLTLELLGIEAIPVPATSSPAETLARGDVDVVLLHGAALRADAATLASNGMPLLLTLGSLDAGGQTLRDPAFPDLPSAPEAIARLRPNPSPELLAALRAVTASVLLDVGLVLPQLSPAGMVALWRRSCASVALMPEVQAEAARSGTRPATSPAAALSTTAIAADVPTLLELRRWLALRHNFPPA